MFLKTLSGRFLILTMIFVMAAEILILVPSIARYRHDYLTDRLERAQIASLANEANGTIDAALEGELLSNAGVYNVTLRRNQIRQLVLSSPIPTPITGTYDLRDDSAWVLIRDAMMRLTNPAEEVIRVMGTPARDGGTLIEVTLPSYPLRLAMLDYGVRILLLSFVISAVTAALLFFAVRMLMVQPIRGVVAMKSYAAAPEDARNMIVPKAGIRELYDAETALLQLQTDLTGALKQKTRLAQLGEAVAKISHDLRNILTVAQLFADRMEGSADPTVARMAPKLVGSIGRAVNLCENTLAFGRAEEPAPRMERFDLGPVVADVIEGETIGSDGQVELSAEVPSDFDIRADREQLFRVITNLVRNGRQAIEATGNPGRVSVSANDQGGEWQIIVSDDGPGLPPKAREHLFSAFQGSVRKGGTGLGLAIASEIVRGHGGRLDLLKSDEAGTSFLIALPKTVVSQEAQVA